MKVTPSTIEGVHIYGPDAAQFESALADILGEPPTEVLRQAIPFAVIVENTCPRSIALLGVRFDMVGPGGKRYAVVHLADTLRNPEKAEIRTGARRFICAEPAYTSLVIRGEGSAGPRGQMNLENLRRMLQITAIIDCVAFDNGMFYGPDTQGSLVRFARESAAEASLLAEVLALESSPVAAIDAILVQAVQDSQDRGRRAVARKLLEGLESGGRDELLRRAKNWRCRIPLMRTA